MTFLYVLPRLGHLSVELLAQWFSGKLKKIECFQINFMDQDFPAWSWYLNEQQLVYKLAPQGFLLQHISKTLMKLKKKVFLSCSVPLLALNLFQYVSVFNIFLVCDVLNQAC